MLSRLCVLLFLVSTLSMGAVVDLKTGPYSGCPGSGCAKGDFRSGSNATTSSASFVITTSTGSFTSADVGKRGVTMDWHAPNVTGGSCWAGYACYSGTSCQFTVASVQSSTSITVNPVAGCGSSGVGFNSSSNNFWAVYSDDSGAFGNALSAAAGGTLNVPSSYKGGIYTGKTISAGTTINCSAGAEFWDPKLNTAITYMMQPGSNVTIQGCTFRGTEPSFGAYYDVLREYNIFIGVFGVNAVLLQNNTFQDSWGTYMVGTSGASNWHVTTNLFKNCGLNGIQTNKTGGSSPGTLIEHNTLENCNIDGEDASGATGTPNKFQTFDRNYVYATAQGGVGYYRTQTSKNLSYTASVNLSVGVAASGGRPYPGEYSGVTISNNTVCGLHTKLMPCPNGGCSYTTLYGQVLVNNTCNNGCNNTAVTGPCPTSSGGSPPSILSYTASPPSISAGSSSSLAWSVTGTTPITSSISGLGTVTSPVSVSPTVTTSYLLTVSNSLGSDTATVTVTVTSTPPIGPPALPAPTGKFGFGYGVRSGHLPEVFDSPTRTFPQYGVNNFSPFNAYLHGTSSVQSHPGASIAYTPSPQLTGLDGRPFGTAGGADINAFSQSVTPVSGRIGVYVLGPQNGGDPSMITTIKLKSLIGWYGHTLLRDVSGPNSLTDFLDSTSTSQDTFCYAYLSGECVASSTQGKIYVSMLNADTGGSCLIDMNDRAPCVVPAAVHAFKYTQFDVTRADPTGIRERVVTSYLNGAGNQENYANHHGTDGAGWLVGWARFANGERSELMGVRDTRWLQDSLNRTEFIRVPIKLSGRTGDTVRIRFGYDPTNLFCTQRQEACSTNPTTAADPFAFTPSESVTPQACGTSGCTVIINAYSNRILYYVVDRINNSITRSSSVYVLAVP